MCNDEFQCSISSKMPHAVRVVLIPEPRLFVQLSYLVRIEVYTE